ncbi:MAG: hypothetical protein ACYCSG_02840 [Thermoplasmataceae archaeon]
MKPEVRIEALQVRKGNAKNIESTADSFPKHIIYRIENHAAVTSARSNAISAVENRIGRFLLACNGEYSGSSCLSIIPQWRCNRE